MLRVSARWPVVVAGIFCIYSVVLLWTAFHSKEQLRVAADARIVADSRRQAAALGDFAAQQRRTTQELARLQELHNYLVNKALGMSPLYGLDASLAAVEQRFLARVSGAAASEHASYRRIAWIDESGKVLVDTGGEADSLPQIAGPSADESTWLDLQRRAIVTTAPVVFKGERMGTVVSLSDIGQLYHSLVETVAEASYRETLLTRDGREIPGPAGGPAFDPAVAARLANLEPGRPTAVQVNPHASGRARNTADVIAISNAVPGLPAVLVTTLGRDEIYGDISSSLFLFSLSACPLLLMAAAIRMDRLQGRARSLELDAARADAHRHVLQDRNESLSEEIRRRQAVEAELQRHRDHLEELVTRRTAELNRLFDALPDSYFRMAHDGTVLEHRSGREQGPLVAAGDMLGRSILDLVPPPVAPKLAAALREVAGGAEQCIAEYEVELDTGRQFYEARALPLGVDQVLMVVRNVTERRQFEEIRESNRREAERLARVKSEFLANMSHEIRTPLNAVLGLAQLGSRNPSQPAALENFKGILEAGRHLLGIVDDILDFSKLEAGKLSVERRAFRLSSAVDAVVGLVSGRMASKGLAMPVTMAPDLPAWVEGDALRLKQILVNLLSNAVKFTDHGHVALNVRTEGAHVVFKVSDTGIGMDASLMKRLFQPFEQADGSTTRRFGGTGLGLAISHNLAELMGGEILVESRRGVGSVFTLRVPLPEAPAVLEMPMRGRSGGARLTGMRVLAAEDNEVNRLILKAQLESEGCRVVFARNGLEALAAAQRAGSDAFDAVLMDVQMPDMDGIEATRKLRAFDPRTPIIGLTAHALPEERDKCLAAGMADHVTKPVDVDRLVASLLQHAAPPEARGDRGSDTASGNGVRSAPLDTSQGALSSG